jgi:hypothetical protein
MFVAYIRCALRSDIRALGHHPSSEDKLKIQDKQESLQSRIEAFHQQGLWFIRPDATLPASSSLNKSSKTSTIDLEESDEETFFLDANSEWEEEEGAEESIEQAMVWLPSSFTKSERIQLGLERIAAVEAELREGQANDALESLRASLAEKSLRFRTEVKPAKSQRTMTRAWDSIHRADKQIRGAVQCYRLARSALEGLGVSSKLLEQYKEIQKKDLKMSRDVVEENRVGQRSWELPWFWRLDRKLDKDRDEFLKECELCGAVLSIDNINILSAVYRVSWLRAKARKERWEEEIELVGREMEWTVRSFQHHEEVWRQRADKAKGSGQKAYAWKQSSTWGEWAAVANGTFGAL